MKFYAMSKEPFGRRGLHQNDRSIPFEAEIRQVTGNWLGGSEVCKQVRVAHK